MRSAFLFLFVALSFYPSLLSAAALSEEKVVKAKLEQYVTALKTQKREALYPYLNDKSLVMIKKRPYSGSMMLREARAVESCSVDRVLVKENRAVLFFLPEDKACSPYFLHYQQGYWRFDLYTMSKAIRFSRGNEWYFVRGVSHPYVFATKYF